jgi:hypothetical protein
MVFKKIFKLLKRAFRLKRKSRRKKIKARRYKKHRRLTIKKSRRKARRISKKTFRKRPRSASFVKRKKSCRIKKSKKEKPFKYKPVGVITHYFPKVNAAVVKLKSSLSLGEPVWIKGKTTDFKQTVGSIQIDRKPLEKAKKGQEIGLEVFKEVKPGDMVYTPRP